MRIRTRRLIVSAIVALGIAVAGTACSSNDQANAGSSVSTPSSTEEPSDDSTFEPEASLEPDPTSLDAESATPTQEPEPTRTPEVDSDVARAAELVPCEAALDRKVIDTTVPGTSKVSLKLVKHNEPNSLSIKYSETCIYTARGADGFDTDVAYVTSMLLTTAGKERYRNACSGDEKFDDVIVNPIGYQYYSHVDDGCTLVPQSNAPADTLPGFVLRYRDKMVIVRMKGFDKVTKDGASVIREVTLKS